MSWHDGHQYKASNQQNKHISIVGKRPRLVHKHKQINTRTLVSVNVNQYYILCVCMCVCVCLLSYTAELTMAAATRAHFRISVMLTCRSISLPSTTGFVYTHLIFYGHMRTICARKNAGDVFDDLEPLDM